ncbi:MAG TPA: alpha/beta hydrolase [Kofleriaceae bacterium]|nr:alpha/beta hydrolase [Kofleriaceae bacterium]
MRSIVLLALAACAHAAPPPALAPAPAPLAHDGTYITVRGIKTYYETHGSGPPLLLLHGGTGSADDFDRNTPALAAHFRVITPERMGHGRTADVPDRPFDYHEMAEDMIAFMDAIHVAKADLVGWSDGGIVALDIAMHHPDRVGKLAVTGANFRVDGLAPEIVTWLRDVKPDDWPKTMLDNYKRLSPDGAAHWPVVFERLRKMLLSQPSYTNEQLKTITAPTLVMAGDDDVIRIEHTIELARTIPGAQLCIYPGGGHFWFNKKADAFNAIILEFLAAPPPTGQ